MKIFKTNQKILSPRKQSGDKDNNTATDKTEANESQADVEESLAEENIIEEIIDWNTSIDGLKWYISDDGTLIVSGEGEMYNYGLNYDSEPIDAPWYEHNDYIKKIIIEDGVTSIGSSAFLYCEAATDVTIPDSVTRMGGSVFSGCTSLTEVTIPDSVINIGDDAFSGCDNLTIRCPAGSYAEFYVDKYNIDYVIF